MLAASILRNRNQNVGGQSTPKLLMSRALENALTALTDEDVTGPEKRILLGTIVYKVVPNKEGEDVFFAPSIFRDAGGEDGEDPDGRSSRFSHDLHGHSISRRTLRLFKTHRFSATRRLQSLAGAVMSPPH